jgi:pyruvate, water dikinase
VTVSPDYLRWFKDVQLEDKSLVGDKNASLGELYRELGAQGVPVPNGFALTVQAFRDALQEAGALPALHRLLDDLDATDIATLAANAAEARQIVYSATGGAILLQQIADGYGEMEAEYGANVAVAVRSSVTADDLPPETFAGQHESYLNRSGLNDLVEACRLCFASIFTDRAIVYRINNGFDHFKIGISVGVMKMIRSDRASSGVVFTLDPNSGFRDVLLITGSYGLGENVVQRKVDPDTYYVHKPTFAQGNRTVLRRTLGTKQLTMTLADGRPGSVTKDVPTPLDQQARFCLTDGEVITLAGHAIAIENHYGRRVGHPVPMDIEWAKDGDTGRLFVVQARPKAVQFTTSGTLLETYAVTGNSTVLATGKAVGEKIGTGIVRVAGSAKDLRAFRPGEILVAHTTNLDFETAMKMAGGIVTDHGGLTSHAAGFAREFDLPAVIGAANATSVLRTGMLVTVSCVGGETGIVYEGEVPFEVTRTDIGALTMTQTHIMVNIGDPDQAFRAAMMPNAGVGLARPEFIIKERIGIHPMALVHPERVPPRERVRIYERIAGFASPQEYFVRNLSEGVGMIAAAFYPKPVIIRLSDFKTNEYAELLGGTTFECRETNPLLGFRGASRYAHPAYAEGFALECQALRRVRDDMGLTNLIVMVPFCRRVSEAESVLAAMAHNRLERGKNGLEVYMMCEVPNNVIQIDAFARLFDGFSIGSNGLTQLTLGVDRDSDMVAFDFDERDPGVLEMFRLAVAGAKRSRRKIGICGQAPANYPDVARFLTGIGIDSISVNPSSLLRTMAVVNEAEAWKGRALALENT